MKGLSRGDTGPVPIEYNGAEAQGATLTASNYAVASNPSATPYYTASSPFSPNPFANVNWYQPTIITLTVSSNTSINVNDWVLISGCAYTQGQQVINNTVGQVAFSSSTSLIVTAAWTPVYTGSWPTSTCTVTKENVGIAFSADARVDADLNNIQLKNASGVTGTPNALGVDVYFGSRVDSGTRIYS